MMAGTIQPMEMDLAESTRRGRPWAESAVWGALWILSTGETPDWLADHQPSRIRGRLRSLRPGGFLWAVRNRADVYRFRASPKVLETLRPQLRISGASADELGTDRPRLEGYVTPDRFEWIRDGFPVVPDDSGCLIVRVSEFVARVEQDIMPPAFVAADMAGSEDTGEAERGLLHMDDLLREFSGNRRTWLTASDIAQAISVELEQGDEVFALRILAKALSESRSLIDPADIVRFLQEPPSTGDRRWDVLLATAIARECRLRGVGAPKWTNVEGVEPWWFPALVDKTLIPLIIQRTPLELSSKGIWLDEKALSAV
ncbi:MAG: hypothetical protein U9N56_09305 [Actinomycetota bacterium]|nr:hypothetical protein [Actinomycetota bacterium]